jgi:polypeptide N-acetylgalactosaminyltransferase
MGAQYDVPGGFGETYLKNSKRLAEVWMDDYKDIYYLVRPSAKNLEVGW